MGRTLLAAIFSLVLAVSLAGARQQTAETNSVREENQGQHKLPEDRDDVTTALKVISRSIEQNRTPEKTDYEKRQAADDVQAQRDMALWALVMCVLGVAQLIVATLGIWYIRKTLVATEHAVKEAGDATEAAHLAVAETGRIGEAQVRAYVSVIGLEFSWEDDGVMMIPRPGVTLVLNNSGATPADKVAYFCGCECLTISEAREFVCPDKMTFLPRLPTMPAGSTERRSAMAFGYLPKLKEYQERADRFTGDTRIGDMPIMIIWATVVYEDVFNAVYRSDSAFLLEPHERMENVSLKITDAPQRSFQRIESRDSLIQTRDQ